MWLLRTCMTWSLPISPISCCVHYTTSKGILWILLLGYASASGPLSLLDFPCYHPLVNVDSSLRYQPNSHLFQRHFHDWRSNWSGLPLAMISWCQRSCSSIALALIIWLSRPLNPSWSALRATQVLCCFVNCNAGYKWQVWNIKSWPLISELKFHVSN